MDNNNFVLSVPSAAPAAPAQDSDDGDDDEPDQAIPMPPRALPSKHILRVTQVFIFRVDGREVPGCCGDAWWAWLW